MLRWNAFLRFSVVCRVLACVLPVCALAAPAQTGQSSTNPSVFNLGSVPASAVVNPISGKVFVPTAAGISVLDGKTLTTIPIPGGATQAVVNPGLGKVYAINAASGSSSRLLTVITDFSLTVSRTITLPAATAGGSIGINLLTSRLFVSNGTYLSLIEAYNDVLLGSINLQTNPAVPVQAAGSLAVDPSANKVFVGVFGTSSAILAVDTARNTASPLLPNIQSGALLAVNPTTHVLYALAEETAGVRAVRAYDTNSGARLGISSYVSALSTNGLTVDTADNTVITTDPGNRSDNLITTYSSDLSSVTAQDYKPSGGNAALAGPVVDALHGLLYAVDAGNNLLLTFPLLPAPSTSFTSATATPQSSSAVGATPVGVAFSPETRRAYVPSSGSILTTFAPLYTVTQKLTNQYSNYVAIDPINDRAFVSSKPTDPTFMTFGALVGFSLTDPVSSTVIQNVSIMPIRGGAGLLVIDPLAKRTYAYTPISGANTISIYDEISYAPIATVTLPGTSTAGTNVTISAITVNPFTHQVYVAVSTVAAASSSSVPNSVQLYALDGNTNSVTPIGAAIPGTVYAMGVNVATNTVFAALYFSASGSLAVIQGNSYMVNGTPNTSAKLLEVDETTNTVYVAPQRTYADNGGVFTNIQVYHPASNSYSAPLSISAELDAMELNRNTQRLYVSGLMYSGSFSANLIASIDVLSGGVVANIPSFEIVSSIGVDAARNLIYAGRSVIDGNTDASIGYVAAQINIPPKGAVINPLTGTVYFAGDASNSGTNIGFPAAAVPSNTFIKAVVDSSVIASSDRFVETSSRNPAFTVTSYSPPTAAGQPTPSPSHVYYKLDSLTGPFQMAGAATVFPANPAVGTVQLNNVTPGFHTLYAFATYGSEDGTQPGLDLGNSPMLDQYTAFSVVVTP